MPVHHHYLRCPLGVALGDGASEHQGNSQRFKEFRADPIDRGADLLTGLWRVSLDVDSLKVPSTADQRAVGEAHRAHAGQRFEPPRKLLIEARQALACVTVLRRVNAKQQQVSLVESRIDVFEIGQRADEQPCPHQQRQR